MKPDITEPSPGPVWKRLVWFAAIWAVSVGALGIVALAIRKMLG
jgi:hypothetical protein